MQTPCRKIRSQTQDLLAARQQCYQLRHHAAQLSYFDKVLIRLIYPLLCFVLTSETGGICIAPKPSEPDAEIVPGMAMRPFFGIKPVLMDTEVNCFAAYASVCVLPPQLSHGWEWPWERVRLGL
ncbi:hypothetical protein ILYODFUR_018390 [Ilyodon furcidens]|uniref:Uncharacterized protein n=1 Tax=Ilyodon furcidens TaxID=33524 RepID=A0ABV0SML8_9TELE